jgi:hypothetical protein
MIDTTAIDEVFKHLEETDKLKQQAIQQLLEIRAQIDEKLARLGYVEGGNSQGLSPKGGPKKRHRRTKAEMEAARQVELKTKQLPGEHQSKSRTQKTADGSEAHGKKKATGAEGHG